jgi:imidazoleglycerol-phosphate dehydratase
MIELTRKTRETDVRVELELSGRRALRTDTGIGFFDHLLTTLAFWAGWDLTLVCQGDLEVDTHHTVEDVAITLGRAFNEASREHREIERIAHAYVPLDEALSRIVVDVCNRPYCRFEATFSGERVGGFETAMTEHFFRSFAMEARITLHVCALAGSLDHHVIESMFKGLGLVLRRALVPRQGGVASTKGEL